MREPIGVPQRYKKAIQERSRSNQQEQSSGNHASTYTSICEHFGKRVSSLVTWSFSEGRCGAVPGAVPGASMGVSMGCAVCRDRISPATKRWPSTLSVAISRNQSQSDRISPATKRWPSTLSVAISRNQSQSDRISPATKRWPSTPSVAISRNQSQSVAISRNQIASRLPQRGDPRRRPQSHPLMTSDDL
jgi:hypothetical protein